MTLSKEILISAFQLVCFKHNTCPQQDEMLIFYKNQKFQTKSDALKRAGFLVARLGRAHFCLLIVSGVL